MKAPCHAPDGATVSTMAGVTPEPRKPANCWIENASDNLRGFLGSA